MENNLYYPFQLITNEGECNFTITLGDDMKWNAFEKEGYLGNGYDWARFLNNLLKDKNPKLLVNITIDAEADTLCIYSSSKEKLQAIAKEVTLFFDVDDLLAKYILEYANYS